ncbi:hypothetical protein HDE_07753 [Halotydeus destructor]|nr:hypothetical protein HDE_07753 [Halotydeus destructor]
MSLNIILAVIFFSTLISSGQADHSEYVIFNGTLYSWIVKEDDYNGQIMILLTIAVALPLVFVFILCIAHIALNLLTRHQHSELQWRRSEHDRYYDEDVMQMSYEYPPKYDFPPSYQKATRHVVKKYLSSSL